MAPLSLVDSIGSIGFYIVAFLMGCAFGAILEMAGFGDSRKLAAQFYFKDLTVLKVMFTAIIVAMLLIFGFSAIGLLDYDLIWVNPTYLWPGILGGLIMGVGFIIGGFCPGTSVVSMATFKLDGLFFVLGCSLGIFAFGETVNLFRDFWYSSYMGRFTIPEWLGLPAGVVTFLVVLMALGMFLGAELLEQFLGDKEKLVSISPKFKKYGVIALLSVAFLVLLIPQPSAVDKWNRLPEKEKAKLKNREVHIEPIELLNILKGRYLNSIVLDLRNEKDYNIFHIVGSKRIDLKKLKQPSFIHKLQALPKNTVIVLLANDEENTSEAWKILKGEKIPNIYILAGGVNHWISYFNKVGKYNIPPKKIQKPNTLRYKFESALGELHPCANPDFHRYKHIKFKSKLKLEVRKMASGGCG